MDLSFLERGHNRVLFDRLRMSQLHHYIKPMEYLFILEKEQKIKLSKVSLKKLMGAVHLGTRKELEMHLQAFLLHYGVITPPQPRSKPKPASVRERVRRHRNKLKRQGYKTINVQLPIDKFTYIKNIKRKYGYKSYSELFYSCVFSKYNF